MKKIISLFIFLAIFANTSFAQNAHRNVGRISVDAGIGFGFVGRGGYSLLLPPLKVDADYTLLNFGDKMSLSVGGYFSLGIDRHRSYETSVTTFLVGPMVCFRYAIADNFNLL